ncbi:endolytic transglycosylase MltG [Alteromonas sp. D210916BOD_24]|uniref:endolytic transglycosylase MltG n=1 Tax=Alteromonas sp. D210916BOD_24 TaxID=3157618 RepID=UPI00399CB00F
MRRFLLGLLFLSIIVAVTLVSGIFYLSNRVSAPLTLKTDTLVTIESGSNAYRTVKFLRNEGYSQISPLEAKLWLKFFAGNTSVKSGTYQLSPGDTLVDAFRIFTQGEEYLFAVSLVEGLTLAQWISELNYHPEINFDLNDDVLKRTIQQSLLNNGVNWCCEDVQHAEGLFLADTYFFTRGTKASEILARAHRALVSFVSASWDERAVDLPLTSPYEALILASIIEKETAVASERDLIAGVFTNRLNKNMRLQTDPTVIYGIGPTFDGNITRAHLRTPTPYNTYMIKGLPPTPIAMAGKAAIEAALHPMDTEALYFVARGDGSHEFSTTLEAHNAAVRKYQLKR